MNTTRTNYYRLHSTIVTTANNRYAITRSRAHTTGYSLYVETVDGDYKMLGNFITVSRARDYISNISN